MLLVFRRQSDWMMQGRMWTNIQVNYRKKPVTPMNNTYGYIRGTKGVDGDQIDVFLSDDMQGDVFFC